MFSAISWHYKHLHKVHCLHKFGEKKPNFLPSYLTAQDIIETVICFQNKNQMKIHFLLILFQQRQCFCDISGSLAARNTVKYIFKMGMNRTL